LGGEPTTIDQRFLIEREVAAGGMGTIYRAQDRHTGKPVALKVMHPDDAIAIERFRREAALLAEVRHPGVVEYVAHGDLVGGAPYLVMEWLDGVDLAERLAGVRADTAATLQIRAAERAAGHQVGLPIAEVVALARRLASALGAVHRRGVIHRDLKPSNVFLVDGELARAKLIDFGTARETAGARPLTASGMLVGTPFYMAPEQVKGGALGAAVDVWALGCVLYECLTGRSPFAAAHPLAALARIVVDEPPWVDGLRADCPPPLASLVHACLTKEISGRPAHGDAVTELLKHVDSGVIAPAALGKHVPTRPAPRLTTSETVVSSLVFARVAAADLEPCRAMAEHHGAHVEALADRATLLISTAGMHAPRDLAARSAQLALALRAVAPTAALVVTTGRESGGRTPVAEVVDGAIAALVDAPPGAIFLDKLTAGLLDGRFEVTTIGDRRTLVREQAAEGARTLLGKPSRWVGRRRELTTLTAVFDECVDDGVARAVLVTAGPGLGKSRLRHELVRSLASRGALVVHGQGDAFSAGAPFLMLALAIRRCAGVVEGEPIEARRRGFRDWLATLIPADRLGRVATFLGELAGVSVGDDEDALRAAKADPMLLGELMRGAFEDWLRCLAARQPVLLVLEDLHWGDLPSVTYIDAALRALADQPIMVLALARPEVTTVFPQLWASRDLQEIRLTGLPAKACAELITDALGERATPAIIEQIVARAEGNAFYLEELIRAVAEGDGLAVPVSVIGMVQARLAGFDLDARRLLRAGAVFGEVFWEGGVRALLGDDAGAFDTREWLNDLERREVVTAQPSSRVLSDREYKFRHALVRDAAYDMLTEDDRVLGHRLAGVWLEAVGGVDPLVLAGHFERGDDRERAVFWFACAAEEALESNDLVAVGERAARAVAAGAAGPVLGAIRTMQSIASYWRSAYAEARDFGRAALPLVPAGSTDWFRATGSALVGCARLADYEGVDALFEPALAMPAAPGAEAAQLICLCRGAFQLIFNGRFARADQVLARIAALAEASTQVAIDALTRAQVEHVQGVRAAHVGDVARFLRHLEAAVAAFERAGDVRNVSLERTTVAWCYGELGFAGRAEALCRANLEHCRQLRAAQAITYARVNLGFILILCPGKLDEAIAELGGAIEECRAVGNQRLEGWARAHLAAATRLIGDHAASHDHAATAATLLATSPGLLAWARAAQARALVALGRPEEAAPLARAAVATLAALGGLLQGESLPPLALAEALIGCGDRAGAQVAIADAVARLEHRAARLGDEGWRAAFLALPDNVATRALAAALA
jgi:tRNA A-37 threonylcarbamoyl transferase component Bud32/tetratricopeptide (TPR) repeat protein